MQIRHNKALSVKIVLASSWDVQWTKCKVLSSSFTRSLIGIYTVTTLSEWLFPNLSVLLWFLLTVVGTTLHVLVKDDRQEKTNYKSRRWLTKIQQTTNGQVLIGHCSNLWLLSAVVRYDSLSVAFLCSILKYSLSPTSTVGIIYISSGCLSLPNAPSPLPSPPSFSLHPYFICSPCGDLPPRPLFIHH